MITLTRRYGFPAAHVLTNPALSSERNHEIFGKCANPNGHGHDYGVELTVAGTVDRERGEIIAPELLDAAADEAFRQPFGHRMLNQLDAFRGRVPTAEVITEIIFERVSRALATAKGVELVRVRVVETARNSFEVGLPA